MATKTIHQLGFREHYFPKGVPVVDCRVLKNPFTKYLTDESRKRAVRSDPRFEGVVIEAVELLKDCDEIVVACAHGRHRSGAVADEVAHRTGAKIRKTSNG